MSSILLWMVLITSLDGDKKLEATRKYIVVSVTADFAVSSAFKFHRSVWTNSEVVGVQASRFGTNVVSIGKVK